MNDENESNSNDLKCLAQGSLQRARRFSAYNVNGFKFRTMEREHSLKTQNSGVFVISRTRSHSRISDNNLVNGDVNYYGKLVDIIELNYYGRFRIILCKCKWANTITDRGIKQDVLQFTLVNFSRLIHTGEREEDEPYIEASQAQQVYYVEDVVEKDWSAVVHLKPRDLYDMGEDTEETFYENEPYQAQDLGLFFPNDTGILSLRRAQIDDDPMPNVENIDDEDDEDM